MGKVRNAAARPRNFEMVPPPERGPRTLEVVAAPKLQPQELFIQIGRKRYQVESIEQAVAMFVAARDASGLGSSQMPRATIVNAHGTHLYGISYNGRVWDGDKPLDGMSGDEWVRHATVGSAK